VGGHGVRPGREDRGQHGLDRLGRRADPGEDAAAVGEQAAGAHRRAEGAVTDPERGGLATGHEPVLSGRERPQDVEVIKRG